MARRRNRPKNPYARPDRFTDRARDEGYAARSVYKLTEIQKRFRPLAPGQRVVDLGCAPGSWWRYAAEIVGPRGAVLGIDITEPEDRFGPLLVASILDVGADDLTEALGGPPQVVLSDMAPRTTGDPFGDHVRQLELARRALQLATEVVAPGGALVCKVFEGEEAQDFVVATRGVFGRVKRVRPDAVRRTSREFFVVGMDRRS